MVFNHAVFGIKKFGLNSKVLNHELFNNKKYQVSNHFPAFPMLNLTYSAQTLISAYRPQISYR